MRSRVNGFGGVIAVDTKGRVGIHYTTANMSWAQIGGEGEGSNPSRVKYGCSLADVNIDMLWFFLRVRTSSNFCMVYIRSSILKIKIHVFDELCLAYFWNYKYAFFILFLDRCL